MTMNYRRQLILLMALSLLIWPNLLMANGVDESGLVVAEELLIEEAISGDLEPQAVELSEEIDDQLLSEDILAAEDVDVQDLVEELVPEVSIAADETDGEPAMEVPAQEAFVLEEKGLPVEQDMDESLKMSDVEEVAEEVDSVDDLAVEALGDEEPPVLKDDEVADLDQIVEGAFVDAVETGVETPPVVAVTVPAVQKAPVVEQSPVMAPKAVQQQVMEESIDPRRELVRTLAEEEALKREAIEEHSLEQLKMARIALRDGRYEDAAGSYKEALAGFRKSGVRAANKRYRQEAQRGIEDSYYRWAVELRENGDYAEAEVKAREAQAVGHPDAIELIGLIIEDQEEPEVVDEEPMQDRWDQEEYKDMRKEIRGRLVQGRQYYATGEFAKAKRMFEVVLKHDPHNSEAIRLLAKVNQKLIDVSTRELEATRRDMIADVRSAWNPRDYGIDEEPGDFGGGVGPVAPEVDPQRQMVMQKMERIMIPELNFRQANIYEVIDILQDASVEFDLDEKDVNQRGVNIILNLQKVSSAAAAPSQRKRDPFATAVDTGSFEAEADTQPVTLNVRNVTLMQALETVTKVAGLKYRVEGKIVMVVPVNAPDADIVHRMYDVLPSLGERIEEIGGDVGSASEDVFGVQRLGGSEGGVSQERADWKNFFAEMGVPWPDGSKIKYVPTIGKLIVANTVDNLAIFERILSVLNVVPNQIEIEARFVEVNQVDLNALGFEWMLTDDWEIAKKTSSGTPLSSQERIIMGANEDGGGFTRGNRFAADGINGISAIQDDIMSIAGVLTNPELTMILHALEQKGHADTLSAPKVTTQSGSEAEIKVVTEYIYPTAYELKEFEISGGGDGSSINIPEGLSPFSPEPQDFETREVGIILQVTPEVSTEGQMINLSMTPQVVDEPTWYDYGYTVNGVHLPMEMPFFHSRSVTTSIAIYNGATVVMGGMINELRTTVDDKIPILGDIPLIGRLFRSQVDQSDKRNLLIFVTARMVDPAGRPVQQASTSVIDEAL